MQRWIALIVMVLTVAGVASVTAAPLDPEPVLTGRGNQYYATADEDRLAWTEQAKGGGRPLARIRAIDSTGRGRVVNDAGRRGSTFSGGFNGGELLYQQVKTGRRWRSDLRVFDPSDGSYHAPPAGVNTKLWEWRGAWSDGYVLFGRNDFRRNSSPWKVILVDRNTGIQLVLATVTDRCACIWPGDVTDQYATWTVCKDSCEVFVYDIAAESTVTAPNPGQKDNYYSSLTPDGDLYFGHAGAACGRYVKIERWPVGDPSAPVVVTSLPRHFEIAYGMSAFTRADLHTDLYFSRFDCRKRFRADVFVIHDAETARQPLRQPPGPASGRALATLDARPLE